MTPELNRASRARTAARAFALVALFLPIALPLAIVYARRAREGAGTTASAYSWPMRLIDRPVTLFLVVWLTFLAVMFILMGVLSGFGVPPV